MAHHADGDDYPVSASTPLQISDPSGNRVARTLVLAVR